MQPIAVESTTLARVAYNGPRRALQLEFRSGSVYRYFDVPPETFQQLTQASSKGQYFNRDIRGRFLFTRLNTGHDHG